jgi:hypothetical protein
MLINKECFIAETQDLDKQQKLFVAIYLDDIEMVKYCVEELHASPNEIMELSKVNKCKEIAENILEMYNDNNKEEYN